MSVPIKFQFPGGARGAQMKYLVGGVATLLFIMIFFGSCTTYVAPNEVGIVESRIVPPTGVRPGEKKGGKIYFLLLGQTIHTFPKDLQVLDFADTREGQVVRVRHQRLEPAVQINTSDGSQVQVDMTILYRLEDASQVMRQTGAGRGFEDNALIPKMISALKKNLGEMLAEDFYNVEKRAARANSAEEQIRAEMKPLGISVEHVLIRQYYYNPAYQAQIEEKKIQDQLKFTNMSQAEAAKEQAKKLEIDAQGKANVQIEIQRGHAEVTKIKAEASAYSRKRKAEADLLVQIATAKGTELENTAYQGMGSENLVGMEMADVLRGLEVIVVPAGGKGGVNPLDLDQQLRLFDVK